MKNLLLISLLAILFYSCEKADTDEKRYYYVVTTSGPTFDVTIEGNGGGTEQYSNLSSGWEYDCGYNSWLYVSGQINGTGTITVKIKRDGETLDEATSSGQYVIATADWSSPL